MFDLQKFCERHRPTFAPTVSKLVGIPPNRVCFQACRLMQHLLQEEYSVNSYLFPGVLIFKDQPDCPLVVSHCMVVVRAEGRFQLIDLCFTGPESYSVDKKTRWQFVGHNKIDEVLGTEFGLPADVRLTVDDGVALADEWWEGLSSGERTRLLLSVRIAANGGQVVVL